MKQIVTAVELPEEASELLEGVGSVVGPAGWREALGEAEALITPVNVRVGASLLEEAPRLRIVANAGVGYDNLDIPAARERGIILTNTPGVLTEATADIALLLTLAVVRGLPAAERSLRRGEFSGWGFGDYLQGDIQGARVGILGMGRIGQAYARRVRASGAIIQYHSRGPINPAVEQALEATRVDRDTLFRTSDILSIHAAYSPSLHHHLDTATFRLMQRGSYLVNTARGAFIDEQALVTALHDGHLAGAGLDVYEHEPKVHPGLQDLENVVLLPHIGSATPKTRTAMARMACENAAAVLRGEPPLTPIPG
ncbi:MAG: D-glycerate dehydrogenase [Gemmatimonadota bacterium]|jgi:glyoxylate reductase|nr:D-glycerate dehydrogenase [Gemmatimonadota bacterium]